MSARRMILHGNSFVRSRRRTLKADPWQVYDASPAPIRAVLQEGPEQPGPLASRRELRRWRRWCSEAEAIAATVRWLEFGHLRAIAEAAPWQPPGHGRRKPVPSPHILAGATIQTSKRAEP